MADSSAADLDLLTGKNRSRNKPVGTSTLITTGLVVIALFFGVGLFWLGLAPLSSAAIAPGVVSVAGSRKSVQHLDGGIVREILVSESDSVAADQPLIRLDDTQLRSEVARLDAQLAAAAARAARLQAELAGSATIAFPTDLTTSDNDLFRQIIDDEKEIFVSRRQTLTGKIGMINQQIGQQNIEIGGLEKQIVASRKLMGLLTEEVAFVDGMMTSGLGTRTRVFELRRDVAEFEESLARLETNIAVARGSVEAMDAQITDLQAARRQENAIELRKTKDRVIALREELAAAKDILQRTTLRAPIAGKVVSLKVHTVGGVVAGKTPLLEIVPDDDQLVVEVQLDPKDRDVVLSGMPAEVRFSAFNQRSSMPISGRLVWISADRLIDARTGSPHYLARVELTEDPAAALDGKSIFPGMQATAMIVTGERTVLGYLLRPLTRSLSGAFKEE